MSILPNFLCSLLLTTVFSFTVPLLFIGGILGSLFLLSYIPNLELLGQSGAEQILEFLSTFGSGHPGEGLLIIGITCSLVGAMFDTYAFYRYQNLRGQ